MSEQRRARSSGGHNSTGHVAGQAGAAAGPAADRSVRLAAFDELLRVAIRLRRHVEQVAREYDLSAPQARLVITLEQPLRMQLAAELTACEPSHLTALADQLEQLGLITREPDPDDRRVRQLSLTTAGRRLRARLVPAMLDAAPVIADLDEADCATLRRLIDS
ncbi:MarR family winged helix-turn-helix transcriptional regulator [Nakamurella aerolata]|uniref:MarR family transcriptional regulator n=1 Tax=Nakamurella aerolata TaxID=1656892 RepID=A0A849A7W5_9ACTN|nr:MarR family transcriptional regulator [Nakamurella aerolata]NNG35198.1 MarR family transcriptional regulator [Nakamurella aerolata]